MSIRPVRPIRRAVACSGQARCRLLRAGTPFRRQVSLGLTRGLTTTSAVPPGDWALCIATQALRAWLLSACPSGTKAIRPSKGPRTKLALMGLKPWVESSCPFETKNHPNQALTSAIQPWAMFSWPVGPKTLAVAVRRAWSGPVPKRLGECAPPSASPCKEP